MERYLVTGGAGFIGSHIAEALVERSAFVRILDNFSSGKEKNLVDFRDKIDLIKGDICSYGDCLKATKDIDFVFHEAALRSVPKSLHDPKGYNDVNIQGTLNVLQACVENKIKMLVLASSSSVYGDTAKFPEKENFLTKPISPYALTKLTDEHYCKIYSTFFGLPTACLRYFNVFGPRQSLDDEYAIVIPKFISCILKDEQPPIYGTGMQSRDFTFVSNVVNANILATKLNNPCGEVFNIASGRDYTVLDLVKILNRITSKNIKPVFLDKRPGDVFKTLADLSHSKKMLGFRPEVDFVKGLEITVDYFKKNA